MTTNTKTIDTFQINDNEAIEVSLTTEYYTNGMKPFAFATLEFFVDGEPVETLSIADAERLHAALGEAIQAAKSAIDGWLSDIANDQNE